MSEEGYKPTSKEIKKAEKTMTEDQTFESKRREEKFEELYKIGNKIGLSNTEVDEAIATFHLEGGPFEQVVRIKILGVDIKVDTIQYRNDANDFQGKFNNDHDMEPIPLTLVVDGVAVKDAAVNAGILKKYWDFIHNVIRSNNVDFPRSEVRRDADDHFQDAIAKLLG